METALCFSGVSSVMKVFSSNIPDRSRTPVRALPPPPRFNLTPRPRNRILVETAAHVLAEQDRSNLMAYDLGRMVARQYPTALIDQTAEFFQDTYINKPYHERQAAVRKYKLNAVAGPNYKDTCKAISLAQECARMIRNNFGAVRDPTEHFTVGMIEATGF